jgi:hypothetical protein
MPTAQAIGRKLWVASRLPIGRKPSRLTAMLNGANASLGFQASPRASRSVPVSSNRACRRIAAVTASRKCGRILSRRLAMNATGLPA